MQAAALTTQVQVDDQEIAGIIARFNTPVPRYTSYPTALEWRELGDDSLLKKLSNGKITSSGVYLHIPFCENRCLFCGCHVIISKRKEFAERYLKILLQEVDDKTALAPQKIVTEQIHLGGGTPNYLTIEQMGRLLGHLRSKFEISENCEISIELDPVVSDVEYLHGLKKIGFNRVSFGIQDINPQVLDAVDRPQDIHHLDEMVANAIKIGFDSVNVDFIYGLPFQTIENFKNNLDWINRIRPQRIAMFSYAHVPWLKKHQLRMSLDNLPTTEDKLKIYLMTRSFLLNHGYIQIGMDHYALPSDTLATAFRDKRLYRNFMGYTTTAAENLLAFGVSGISYLDGVFAQNKVKLKGHEESVLQHQNYFEKGFQCSEEDRIRAAIIMRLMGNMYLDFSEIERLFAIPFHAHFAGELQNLQKYADQGLVILQENSLEIKPAGLFALRHISSVFDAYRKENTAGGFSKGI